jgi:hypothetical protein
VTVEHITRDELAEALKTVHLWARLGPSEPRAWRMVVLHPSDAANDIFTSVQIQHTRKAAAMKGTVSETTEVVST